LTKLSLIKMLFCLLLGFASLAFAVNSVEILPAEQAFQFSSKIPRANNNDQLLLSWDIADGYYLYRHKFKFVSLTPGVTVGEQAFPPGHTKHDEFFGDVEIFRDHLEVAITLLRQEPKLNQLTLAVTYQGCADAGVCFMPINNTIAFALSEDNGNHGGTPQTLINTPPLLSEQEGIAASLMGNAGNSRWLVILSFLGFGLLLAFTPCVFPMIPILSGIIAGQGAGLTTRRALMLSLCYVLASAVTYTVFGVLAGLFGSNLQAVFQAPWVIMVFSGIFVLLACSMFGGFQLQMPAFIQTKISLISAKQKSGNLLGAALMGMLSALAIGPCVTAPLAGALIYIGNTGDAMLGGVALFSLGIGMGIPLLIIGTSAGKLLPKAGVWMNVTKVLFGLGLLAVAIWLLERILPPETTLILWGALLIIPLLYLSWKKLWKGAGLVALIYTTMLVVGIATHQQRDTLQLLCVAAVACEAQAALPFQKVSSVDELQHILAEAQAQGHWVMLDFYADWCVACKEMDVYTFSDLKIREALTPMRLVQADVTANLLQDQALLKKFNLIGPPAILFFGPDQQERPSYRVIGYVPAEKFQAHLGSIR